jgi:uncharacterized Fe-S cluster protein YjdI
METETRYQPGVLRDYEGEGVVVHWEPKLCIHAANCIRALPGAFDPNARPWVTMDAASADDIAAAIRSCPTGALRYKRTDGTSQEMPDIPTTVQPLRNGPVIVRGDMQLLDADGKLVRSATRAVLCRCGQSQNKPFCDLSHKAAGFEAD